MSGSIPAPANIQMANTPTGAIGSTIMAKYSAATSTLNAGDQVAGSDLIPSAVEGQSSVSGGSNSAFVFSSAETRLHYDLTFALAGTWELQGSAAHGLSPGSTKHWGTLWKRIA